MKDLCATGVLESIGIEIVEREHEQMRQWAMIVGVVLSLAGCGEGDGEKLVLTGSSTVAPVVAEIARRYEAEHPGVRIDVQTGGSSRGVNDARNGLAAIGMVSRDLKASEGDLRASTIAWDGITVILHRDNPVRQLSRAQIIGIYTGAIDNWRQLGGADRPIVVVNKAQGRSTLELFLKHFALGYRQVAADVIVGDNQQGLKTVAGNVDAIGYVSIGAAAYEAQQGAPLQLLAVDGVAATLANVEQGRFPIARPLNLVTPPAASARADAFIRFAQSAAVADIIQQHYFIPADAS